MRSLLYDIVDAYHNQKDANSHQRILKNTQSNNGWYKCRKSFRKEDMNIDHTYPILLGEANSRNNLQWIYKHCNSSKHADISETAKNLVR